MEIPKKYLSYTFGLIIIGLLAPIFTAFFWPNISELEKGNPKTTAFIEYRKKQWEEKGARKDLKQNWVTLREMSPNLLMAVVIAEDNYFWQHSGFDFGAMKSATVANLKAGSFKYGASTITQQLVKNLYLSPAKNPLRKLREAVLTWRIERELSKERILEIYLNVVEWGDGVFGVEAAAQKYYNKPAIALTFSEAAHLAAVLPNPNLYQPTVKSEYVSLRVKGIFARYKQILAQISKQ